VTPRATSLEEGEEERKVAAAEVTVERAVEAGEEVMVDVWPWCLQCRNLSQRLMKWWCSRRRVWHLKTSLLRDAFP